MIKRIKNNQFARNSIILFAGTMAASFLNYIFHLSVGRMVSAAVYGEVESLISLGAIVSVPAASLTMITTKFGACNKADDDCYGSLEILSFFNKKILFYGLPALSLALILSPYIKDFFRIESVWPLVIIWTMMFLSFFGAVTGGLLNGWQRFMESSWSGIWGALLKLISAIVLIKIGYHLNGAIGGFAIGVLVSYLASLYYLRFLKKGSTMKKNNTRLSIRNHIWPILLGNLAVAILANVDMVLAKHNLNPELAGQYGALTIISKIIFFATGIVGTVLFSMASEDNHKKNDTKKSLRHAIYLMALISIPALLVYYLFPGFIIGLLFGNKYPGASPYLVWFAVSVVLFSFANLFFQYLLSINEFRVAYIFLFVSIAASAAILFVGTDIFAIIAIMMAAQTLAVISGLYFLFKRPILR